jgi:hypothetical protein
METKKSFWCVINGAQGKMNFISFKVSMAVTVQTVVFWLINATFPYAMENNILSLKEAIFSHNLIFLQ